MARRTNHLSLVLGWILLAASVSRPAFAEDQQPAPELLASFKLHYANRVQAFKEQNEQLRFVVLVGDSITEGFDVAKFFSGRRILNRGIGADVIGNALPPDDDRGILRRMDESIFDCAPTDVFILIGINDLQFGHTPEAMESGYREILQRVKSEAPAVRVHVISVLPTSGGYAKYNLAVNDFNGRLRKLTKGFGYDYIDLHAKFVDDKGELKAEFTQEGLHLTAEAYRIWAGEVGRVLKW